MILNKCWKTDPSLPVATLRGNLQVKLMSQERVVQLCYQKCQPDGVLEPGLSHMMLTFAEWEILTTTCVTHAYEAVPALLLGECQSL